jgi:UDP-N-acetylmuramoylalanine--D-glutamate ligase
MLDNFLNKIRNKSVHIVGVTGAEGSSILRFLLKHKITKITAHDFLGEKSFEKSFRLWHKGILPVERTKLFHLFKNDISRVKFFSGKEYLTDISSADIIFVPQSWRLYKRQNQRLWQAKKRGTPFYSLTRLYLDFAPATVVGVTGTVGKGSVANILVQLLKKCRSSGRSVYFAGNETWMVQLADKIDEMDVRDILVLEISHRQLQDGFSRAPQIVIFTNLYPNHLDEVSWNQYKKLKLSLLKAQKAGDYSIINYDSPELRSIASELKSKVIYFSTKNKNMNKKSVQEIYESYMNKKSDHYLENILAASTAANILSVDKKTIRDSVPNISSLPARLEYLITISGIKFYDDIKSTTPWATQAAVSKLNPNVILICGGRTKGINYQDFADKIKTLTKHVIILKSELSGNLTKLLPKDLYKNVTNLESGIKLAFKNSTVGDKIVVSPAASFFYSDFIKGKTSLCKIITSLLPKEKV